MQQMLNIFILRMLGIGYFSATYHANSDSHANHAIPSFSFAARIENHWGRSDLPLQCIVFWTVFFWWLQELATSHKLHSGMATKEWLPCQAPLPTLQIPHIRSLPEIGIMLACGNTFEQFFCWGLWELGTSQELIVQILIPMPTMKFPHFCSLPESKIIEVDLALPLQCIACWALPFWGL